MGSTLNREVSRLGDIYSAQPAAFKDRTQTEDNKCNGRNERGGGTTVESWNVKVRDKRSKGVELATGFDEIETGVYTDTQ